MTIAQQISVMLRREVCEPDNLHNQVSLRHGVANVKPRKKLHHSRCRVTKAMSHFLIRLATSTDGCLNASYATHKRYRISRNTQVHVIGIECTSAPPSPSQSTDDQQAKEKRRGETSPHPPARTRATSETDEQGSIRNESSLHLTQHGTLKAITLTVTRVAPAPPLSFE